MNLVSLLVRLQEREVVGGPWGPEAGWPVGHWARSRAWGLVSGSGDAGLGGEKGSGCLLTWPVLHRPGRPRPSF